MFTITEENNGQTVTVKPGENFDVRLPMQGGTGYSWNFLQAGDSRLSVTIETRTETAPPGGRGEAIFRVHAKSPGQLALVFEYTRPWEKTQTPARILKVNLQIGA